MSKYFGTDGFRGDANGQLKVEHAIKTGRFIGWFYGQNHRARILIGKDTRCSGYMFEAALTAGLTASGADVYLLHVTTTPSVSYLTALEGFDCGIMISASHNPYYDNGIKLINSSGEKMEEDVIDKVEAYIDAQAETVPLATEDKIGRVVDYEAGREKYLRHILSLSKCDLIGRRIGLDCANGSTYKLASRVFTELGAQTFVINNAPNGTNINDDCGSTKIDGLRKFVVDNNLEIGFAFDGDGDRCLCVDENGNLVNGDMVLYLYAADMKERGCLDGTKVVTTVMSNFGLYKALDKLQIGYEKTDVGDKYVYENMRANGHYIGGEESGHTIFGKYANTGDGLLTAIKVMQVMVRKNKKLSELVAPVTIYPQVLKNVRVTSKEKTMRDPDVQAAVDNAAERLGNNGRILLRKSGTEPVLRVMVEAASRELCEENVDLVISAMAEKGHLIEVKK